MSLTASENLWRSQAIKMVIIASLRITYFPEHTLHSPHSCQGLLGGAVVASVDQPVPDVATHPGVGEAVQAQRLLVSHHLHVARVSHVSSHVIVTIGSAHLKLINTEYWSRGGCV